MFDTKGEGRHNGPNRGAKVIEIHGPRWIVIDDRDLRQSPRLRIVSNARLIECISHASYIVAREASKVGSEFRENFRGLKRGACENEAFICEQTAIEVDRCADQGARR